MLVDHLGDGVAKQNYILVKGFNLTLQLDSVDEVNRNRNMLTTQGIEKWILQHLAFIVAHDIFRVQKLIGFDHTTPVCTGGQAQRDSLSL